MFNKTFPSIYKFQIYFANDFIAKEHSRYEHFKKQAFSIGEWEKIILETKKFDGLVGILFETPTTFAPKYVSQIDNHDPLNPVCPVISIFLLLNLLS